MREIQTSQSYIFKYKFYWISPFSFTYSLINQKISSLYGRQTIFFILILGFVLSFHCLCSFIKLLPQQQTATSSALRTTCILPTQDFSLARWPLDSSLLMFIYQATPTIAESNKFCSQNNMHPTNPRFFSCQIAFGQLSLASFKHQRQCELSWFSLQLH